MALAALSAELRSPEMPPLLERCLVANDTTQAQAETNAKWRQHVKLHIVDILVRQLT